VALLGTLKDGFDDGSINTSLWTGNYGDLIESGGRIRIPCTTGYAGLKSASTYTLTGSQILLRAYPPVAGGATSAAASILVLSSTGGTDAGFIVDRAQNAIGLYSRVGYADGSAVFLTYSATDHAWLRLRETGGTLFWDTSADGVNWTNRRTASTPAWASDANLAFLIEAHRDAGTDDYAEADYVNLPPVNVALGTASETSTAQTATRSKTRAAGFASETATVIGPGRAKARTMTAAASSDTAQPLGWTKALALSPASSTENAIAFGRRKTRSVTAAAEADTVQPVGVSVTSVDHAYTVGAPRSLWDAAIGEPGG